MADTHLVVVNGAEHELSSEPDRSLLFALREELDLTGAKYGCGEGVCGACTVLVDGDPVRSCTLPLGEAAGRSVTTVEGLAPNGTLHPAQRAFAEVGAMQCGYCATGMVVATAALLGRIEEPDDAQIRTALQGNVCRCCTYPRILRAVRRASELARRARRSPAPARADVIDEPRPRPRAPWNLVGPDEREYFEVLPEGLVVVLPPEPESHARWFADGGAWLHIGSDGRVTAFTGKVDVGQDNGTALALRVARELRVPVERVELVMGDTDLCPFDPGTFGSLSMPYAGETLAVTAAGARETLRSRAAERWGVDPAELDAANGCVRRAAGGEVVPYGELVRGLRRVGFVSRDTPLTAGPGDRSARRPVPTSVALEVVTGARRYTSDVSRPRMLHGKVLRPPSFGAELRSVDLAAARDLPDVIVAQDGSFVGVAAPDPLTAQRAIEAVQAEWEERPQPSERELVEYLRSHPVEVEGWGGSFEREIGDPEAALAAAEVRLTATYTTAYVAHAPLESRAAVAEWEGDRVTVRTGTQRPFGVRWEVATALGVPETNVRVIVPPTGGGFGGKHTGEAAVEAATLARATGRPVKVRWSGEEEFTWGYVRPAAVIDVRGGATGEGKLIAWEFTNVNSGAAAILCPYDIPNQRIRFQPADSPLRQGSYRALAATANHFARESHLDEWAHELGVDPLELRLRHLSDERLATVFRTAAEHAGWSSHGHERGRGMGIAGGIEKDGRVATVANLRVDGDGRVELLGIVTAFECGAIVDPDNLTNQIEGATVMGLGGALFEQVHFANGRILNARLSEYRVPRITDVPPIDVVLIDRPDVPPAGAGETPIVAVAPAIANAIFAATGRRLRSMPLVPDGSLR